MATSNIDRTSKEAHFYQIYGLNILSDRMLPYLATTGKTSADIEINIFDLPVVSHPVASINSTPIYQSEGFNPAGVPYLQVFQDTFSEEAFLLFTVSDYDTLITFSVNRAGSSVHIYIAPNMRFKDIIAYFVGPVMGSVLRLRNVVALHAGVVNVNGKAIVVIGEKTAGKSTLTAAFASLGFPVLADDIATLSLLDGKYVVMPGYPCLRVLKSSSDFFDDIKLLEEDKVLSFDVKYYLSLNQQEAASANWSFTNTPLPLAGIYFLEPRNSTGTIAIRKDPSSKKLIRLISNMYALYITNPAMQTLEFLTLNDIVRTVDIFSLDRPDNLASLSSVCELIVATTDS